MFMKKGTKSNKTPMHSKKLQTKTLKSGAKKRLRNSNNNGNTKKIFPEHQPFVWLWLAEGRTYQKTADLLKEKFKIQITFNGVYDYQKRHNEEWKEYLAKIKEVRLANAKPRILERQRIANKLRDKILEILDMAPIFWKDLNVASLIKEFNNLLEQIQDESGDKVHKFKGEGMGGDRHFHQYFGDDAIDKFAEQTLKARAKEGTDSRDRIKANRFSDPGSSVSDT